MIATLVNRCSARLREVKHRLRESPIAYRLARGAFWSLLGGVVSRALTMVATIVTARLLGREAYGEVGMVLSTIGVFGVLAGFGLGSTATKYIAEYRIVDPQRAGRITRLVLVIALCSASVMMLVCAVLSPWLAGGTLNRPGLVSPLMASAGLLFISTLGGVQSAALAGFESFRKIAAISIWQGIAAPVVAIPCVWLYGVDGAIAAFTINAALGSLLSSVALGRECSKNRIFLRYDRSIWNEWPILWRFSLPATLSGIIALPVVWITNAMLANQPGGYGELGLFNAANQWRTLIAFLPGLLMTAMLPILADSHGRGDQAGFDKALSFNFRITWIVALPLTVTTIVLGEQLAALFGSQFAGAESMISLLMMATFLNLIATPVGTALAGAGQMWTGTIMNCGWGLTLIVSSAILIPKNGGTGLATAYLIAYLMHIIWVMAYVEVKLARGTISKEWRLGLFTIMVLGATAAVVQLTNYAALTGFLVATVSFCPLFKTMRLAMVSHREAAS